MASDSPLSPTRRYTNDQDDDPVDIVAELTGRPASRLTVELLASAMCPVPLWWFPEPVAKTAMAGNSAWTMSSAWAVPFTPPMPVQMVRTPKVSSPVSRTGTSVDLSKTR